MPRFIADYLTGFLRARPYPRWAEPGMRPRARPAAYPRLRVGGARLAKPLREEQQARPSYAAKWAHLETAGWLARIARTSENSPRALALSAQIRRRRAEYPLVSLQRHRSAPELGPGGASGA
jgi:hypothetical protein